MIMKIVMSLGAQVVGLAVFLCGLFMLAGLAWVLVVGGVAAVAVGTLWEAGELDVGRDDEPGRE